MVAKKKQTKPDPDASSQKPRCRQSTHKASKTQVKEDTVRDKMIIDQLRSAINEKLKDEQNAKKAALIITELIKSPSK